MKIKRIIKDFLPYILIILSVLLIRIVLILNVTVPTGSMKDTILEGDRCMGLKSAYWFSGPERYDIIVFDAPDEPEKTYIKRVIGLPGEVVEIREGVTYVDGAAIPEPYLRETPAPNNYGPYEVPPDCVFVMGDNRNGSNDARFWTHTYVSRDAIYGKAYFIYWPRLIWLDKDIE